MDMKVAQAIETLTAKIQGTPTADEALKYSQAALNLAHTAQVLAQTKKTEKD